MTKIYLSHTNVKAEKSVQEIISEVSCRGASQIRQDFDGKGNLRGLAFLVSLPDGKQIPIELPARIDAMKKRVYRDLGPRQRDKWKDDGRLDEAAYRICWRQLAAWVKAQMALVDLDMARQEEIFLPFIQVSPGKTLYHVIAERGFEMRALKSKE
jgi:hypothetical protein